ncbi:unnamed protein product [Tuber melanosporum]|uniref:(Perigord truffle) hypothetical protein n=1 Tax=Tuber melanosporum (strain Mel28) TaxID=656061 RepID=D5G9H3_TUBMM|nr:uncharacterized protein GSTUM_00003401001 [Tuber melanosporum]CAZ81166.1 unnamed protein product [Tuber melanosporum]
MLRTNTPPSPLPLRLYTHNIRYATTHPLPHESSWPTRLPRIISSIAYTQHQHPSTLLCLQEVLRTQLLSILSLLPRSYNYIGRARDDGHEAGEYSPVIYDTEVWRLDKWRSKWLSPTPERPSKGWDAACIRILTVGYFTHWESGRRVVVLNTHLDDQGAVARRESARMIVEEVREVLGEGEGRGVVLAGDMNSPEGDDAYKIFTASGSLLRDARADVPPAKRYGHQMTFSGFGNEHEIPQRIDFVFAAEAKEDDEKAIWTITNYSVLENKFDDEIYSSDHRPVVVDLILS